MENLIHSIVDSVPSGCIFDSHFVIHQLIKNHSDEYLRFAAQSADSNQLTLSVHGQIGQLINRLDGSLLRKLSGSSYSENIHGNPSPCTCWQKR